MEGGCFYAGKNSLPRLYDLVSVAILFHRQELCALIGRALRAVNAHFARTVKIVKEHGVAAVFIVDRGIKMLPFPVNAAVFGDGRKNHIIAGSRG